MILRIFAIKFWIYLPAKLQKAISKIFSLFFKTRFSRLIIIPYCMFFGLDQSYLDQFEPDLDATEYQSYSEFFNRKFKKPLQVDTKFIWPCEGYLCDSGKIKDKSTFIKGNSISARNIFLPEKRLSHNFGNYQFINIFLHNHNYHRIHAPTDLLVRDIIHQPGELQFLRPWFYKTDSVSRPAFLNERVTVEFADLHNKIWYLTFVGGFGVGTIQLHPELKCNAFFKAGDEIGKFLLGSTLCLASPYQFKMKPYLAEVEVGEELIFAEALKEQSRPHHEFAKIHS